MAFLPKEGRARKTYVYDCMRGPFNNIVYTGLMTLAILIAIRYHEAPAWVKAIIASADSLGRLIAPITLYMGWRLQVKSASLAARYMFLAAVMLGVTAYAPNLASYTVTVVLAYVLFAQPPKLMLDIYSKNYSNNQRGSLVAKMFTISLAMGILVSWIFGYYLDIDIENHHVQFLILGAAALVSGLFLMRIPSTPLDDEASGNAWQNISLLWKDSLFGWMVLSYIVLGVGNAMIIPIRIEYMANPDYAINASNLDITLINVVIQGASMIVSTRVWGYLFDKLHFITTRLLINLCFIVSFITFFASNSLVVMGLSIAVNGFALAGGMIVWNLWVTKVAPKPKVTAYMSAHLACSGLKGVIAPYIGYYILFLNNPMTVGVTAAVVMIVSSLMFLMVKNHPRIL